MGQTHTQDEGNPKCTQKTSVEIYENVYQKFQVEGVNLGGY